MDCIARPPSTNNHFELLPLDERGEPWCDVKPKAALVSVGGPSRFIMSASFEATRDEVAHPRRIAVLLAGVVIDVNECRQRDFTYDKGERLQIRQEIAFNRNR